MSAVSAPVGVIGIGHIGRRVIAGLQASRADAVAYDIASTALDPWRNVTGVRLASSPAEVAANTDVVAVSVLDAEQVLGILDGPRGLLAGAHSGTIVAVLSTISVEDLMRITLQCAKANVAVIDCGVTVMPAVDEDRTSLVAMYGGTAEARGRARNAIEAFTFSAIDCGEPSTGMIAKIARNVWGYASWLATRAAVSLLEAHDADPKLVERIVAAADPEMRMPFLFEHILDEDSTGERRRRIKGLLTKDMSAARQALPPESVGAGLVSLMVDQVDHMLRIPDQDAEGRDGS